MQTYFILCTSESNALIVHVYHHCQAVFVLDFITIQPGLPNCYNNLRKGINWSNTDNILSEFHVNENCHSTTK